MREKVSAPMTSARLCEPERRNFSAVDSAKTNPEHTACRSKATPCVHAERGLDLRRRRGKSIVGRRGADDDEIDVLGREAGVGQRGARRLLAQHGGGLARRGDVPLLDAGALHDPFVAGVDRGGELLIGEDALGR